MKDSNDVSIKIKQENAEKYECRADGDSHPSTILSSIYPVFLGFTLSILFQKFEIKILDPKFLKVELLIFLPILSYYVLDWVVSLKRVKLSPSFYSWNIILVLIFANLMYCGIMVTYSYSLVVSMFLIGIYFIVTGFYDFEFYIKQFLEEKEPIHFSLDKCTIKKLRKVSLYRMLIGFFTSILSGLIYYNVPIPYIYIQAPYISVQYYILMFLFFMSVVVYFLVKKVQLTWNEGENG